MNEGEKKEKIWLSDNHAKQPKPFSKSVLILMAKYMQTVTLKRILTRIHFVWLFFHFAGSFTVFDE